MARTATKTRETEQPSLLPPEQPTSKGQIAKMDKPKRATGTAVSTSKAVQDSNDMLSIVAKAAANPSVDVDKMRALLDMQKELLAEQARREFNDAWRNMHRDIPEIDTDGRIQIEAKQVGRKKQDSPYSTYPNLMKVCRPIMDRNGFSLWHSTEPTADLSRLIVIGYLEHTSGHVRVSKFPLPADPSGSKNNVQGWGSAQSYGRRYTMVALLNIVSRAKIDADDDGKAAGGQPIEHEPQTEVKPMVAQPEPGEQVPTIDAKQINQLTDAIEDCGVSRARFCEHYKINKVEDLPAELFHAAMQACDDFKKKKPR